MESLQKHVAGPAQRDRRAPRIRPQLASAVPRGSAPNLRRAELLLLPERLEVMKLRRLLSAAVLALDVESLAAQPALSAGTIEKKCPAFSKQNRLLLYARTCSYSSRRPSRHCGIFFSTRLATLFFTRFFRVASRGDRFPFRIGASKKSF